MHWETYNPDWLIELAKAQLPHDPGLCAALQRIRLRAVESPAYWRLAESVEATGVPVKVARTITLQHPQFGELILDVLADGSVSGVEFYDRLD